MYYLKPTKPNQHFLLGHHEGGMYATDGSILFDLTHPAIKIPDAWRLELLNLAENECTYIDIKGNYYSGVDSYNKKVSTRMVNPSPSLSQLVPNFSDDEKLFDTGVTLSGFEKAKNHLSGPDIRVLTNIDSDPYRSTIDPVGMTARVFVNKHLLENLFSLLINPSSYREYKIYGIDGCSKPVCFHDSANNRFMGLIMPLKSAGSNSNFLFPKTTKREEAE